MLLKITLKTSQSSVANVLLIEIMLEKSPLPNLQTQIYTRQTDKCSANLIGLMSLLEVITYALFL